jgi:hypothetical protein
MEGGRMSIGEIIAYSFGVIESILAIITIIVLSLVIVGLIRSIK